MTDITVREPSYANAGLKAFIVETNSMLRRLVEALQPSSGSTPPPITTPPGNVQELLGIAQTVERYRANVRVVEARRRQLQGHAERVNAITAEATENARTALHQIGEAVAELNRKLQSVERPRFLTLRFNTDELQNQQAERLIRDTLTAIETIVKDLDEKQRELAARVQRLVNEAAAIADPRRRPPIGDPERRVHRPGSPRPASDDGNDDEDDDNQGRNDEDPSLRDMMRRIMEQQALAQMGQDPSVFPPAPVPSTAQAPASGQRQQDPFASLLQAAMGIAAIATAAANQPNRQEPPDRPELADTRDRPRADAAPPPGTPHGGAWERVAATRDVKPGDVAVVRYENGSLPLVMKDGQPMVVGLNGVLEPPPGPNARHPVHGEFRGIWRLNGQPGPSPVQAADAPPPAGAPPPEPVALV